MGNKKDFELNIAETSLTIYRLTYLFMPYVFDIRDFKNIHEHYYFSVITEILIHLRDLLFKLDAIGNRVDFRDYIEPQPNKGITDITDLIKFYRDAACHNESPNRRNSKGYLFSGNVFAAYDFEDDITLLMGDSKLYVKRHLFRLYQTVLQRFASYIEFYQDPNFREALRNGQAQRAI